MQWKLPSKIIHSRIFFLKKILFDSTQGAVNRLNRETEAVRAKQAELNEKIKQANEELEERASLLVEQKLEVERKNREVELSRQALQAKAEQLALTDPLELASGIHSLEQVATTP